MKVSAKIKKTITTVLSLGVLCCFFASCGTRYTKEIAQLDSLQHNLLQLQADLKQIDTTHLLVISDEITGRLSYIQSGYTDTLDLATAKTLDDYYALKQSALLFVQKYNKLNEVIIADTLELGKLKHDLLLNLSPKEKVADYCLAEQKEVGAVAASVNTLKQISSDIVKKRDSMNAFINTISEEVRLKSEDKQLKK